MAPLAAIVLHALLGIELAPRLTPYLRPPPAARSQMPAPAVFELTRP